MKINDNKPLLMTFIITLSTVPIFSTDMYLPALPKMIELFGASLKLINLTLVIFFVFFAISSLVWGTLSDKYGRKPILLASTGTYVLASLMCALSGSVYQLILFRALQGVGGGAAMAIAMAMVKDVFTGQERERVLVYQSSLMSVAPILAPMVGAELLRLTSWRGTFVILGCFGAFLFLGTLFLREPGEKRPEKSLMHTFSSLHTLIKTPAFVSPLLLFAVAGIPILMFVGSASDIYITGFGLSEQTFSLFFGFNAAFAVIAPFIYILLAKRFSTPVIITLAFALTATSGLWVILSGNTSPFHFAAAIAPSAMASSLIRPPSMNILLEQGRRDTGAASSLMNFSFLAIGCMGMVFISQDWQDRIFIYGLVSLLAGVCALILWPKTWKKCNPQRTAVPAKPAEATSY